MSWVCPPSKKAKNSVKIPFRSIILQYLAFCYSWPVTLVISYLSGFHNLSLDLILFFFGLKCLGPYLPHMEVPRLGVESAVAAGQHHNHSHSNSGSEPRLWPTPRLWQHWIHNPPREDRDRTRILLDTSRVCMFVTAEPGQELCRVLISTSPGWLDSYLMLCIFFLSFYFLYFFCSIIYWILKLPLL